MTGSRADFRVQFRDSTGSFAVNAVRNDSRRVALLALDTGIRMGWAKFFIDGRIHSFGVAVMDRNGEVGVLAQARKHTEDLLENCTPRNIVKEQGFSGGKGFDRQGIHLEGAVLSETEDWPKIPYIEIHQSTARKNLLGFGGPMGVTKKDHAVRDYVEDVVGVPSHLDFLSGKLERVPQDAVDAIFIGRAWFFANKVAGV